MQPYMTFKNELQSCLFIVQLGRDDSTQTFDNHANLIFDNGQLSNHNSVMISCQKSSHIPNLTMIKIIFCYKYTEQIPIDCL